MFKKILAALFTLALTLSLTVPLQAFAQTGTLGSETPYLFCSFYDEGGEAVDGNSLASGSYKVDVMLSGMQNVSICEFTASYGNLAVTSLTVSSVNGDFACGGVKNTGTSLAVVLASKNADCTPVNSEGTVLATLNVTIDASVSKAGKIDFRDYFQFETDSDLTFVEADYGDGYEDCYALSQNADASYKAYVTMTADESPALPASTITVSGKVLIASDVHGESGEFGLRGVKINAYDNEGNVIATAVSNSEGDKATWGAFIMEVPAGTTLFEVGDPVKTNDTVYNRRFTVKGDADVTEANIPVVMCDYNDDGYINLTDFGRFAKAYNNADGTEYNIYCDFNNDDYVNLTDFGQFSKFYNSCEYGVVYSTEISF